MKCKNTITGICFEIDAETAKNLLAEYDCFELVDATKEEKQVFEKTVVRPLTVREKVMKSAKNKKRN